VKEGWGWGFWFLPMKDFMIGVEWGTSMEAAFRWERLLSENAAKWGFLSLEWY